MNKFAYNASSLVCLILLILISITLVLAAEQPENKEALQPSEVVTTTEPSKATRKSPNITFTPTEEISEDLPVSFPADI